MKTILHSLLFLALAQLSYSAEHPGSQLFKKHVFCTFARNSTLWHNQQNWDENISIAANMAHYKQDLDKYIDHINTTMAEETEPVSAFAIEAPARYYGNSVEELGQWTRAVLSAINRAAVSSLETLQPAADNEHVYFDDGWQFSYRGVRLFVVTTAAIYPRTNSRYSGGSEQKWVVLHLQPEYTFQWKFAHLADGVTKQMRKEGIRKNFALNHRDYYADFAAIMGNGNNQRTHEAPRYVKPIHPGDGVVKWWIKDNSIELDTHLLPWSERMGRYIPWRVALPVLQVLTTKLNIFWWHYARYGPCRAI
jgi:hypothetical protein